VRGGRGSSGMLSQSGRVRFIYQKPRGCRSNGTNLPELAAFDRLIGINKVQLPRYRTDDFLYQVWWVAWDDGNRAVSRRGRFAKEVGKDLGVR